MCHLIFDQEEIDGGEEKKKQLRSMIDCELASRKES